MARKASGRKGRSGSTKKPIEQYEHHDAKRVNNPPVGLVTPETDPPEKRVKRYAYDPHIDPALEFDPQGAEVERIIDRGPGGGTGVTQ